jgi:2'-5' RNA ligase
MAHIDTSRFIRGALWIRPTGSALHKIDQAASIAHQRIGGPRIHPHIALLSGVEMTLQRADDRLSKLASRIDPFIVRLGRIGWRHEYFRALFVEVEPSDELVAAHRLAHEVFDMTPPDPFEPHLSLAYGDLHGPLPEEVADELGSSIDAAFRADAVQLSNASANTPIPEWRVLTERPLARK